MKYIPICNNDKESGHYFTVYVNEVKPENVVVKDCYLQSYSLLGETDCRCKVYWPYFNEDLSPVKSIIIWDNDDNRKGNTYYEVKQ